VASIVYLIEHQTACSGKLCYPCRLIVQLATEWVGCRVALCPCTVSVSRRSVLIAEHQLIHLQSLEFRNYFDSSTIKRSFGALRTLSRGSPGLQMIVSRSTVTTTFPTLIRLTCLAYSPQLLAIPLGTEITMQLSRENDNSTK
jgi:hypothetical protein